MTIYVDIEIGPTQTLVKVVKVKILQNDAEIDVYNKIRIGNFARFYRFYFTFHFIFHEFFSGQISSESKGFSLRCFPCGVQRDMGLPYSLGFGQFVIFRFLGQIDSVFNFGLLFDSGFLKYLFFGFGFCVYQLLFDC